MSEEQNLDYAIALSLQDQYDKEKASKAVQRAPDLKRIVDKHWELIDPNPDIHQLFVDYDSMYFWKKLTGSGVAVNWSNRMTLCAGVCSYEGRGGFCSIRLSQPLLKLRPRRDLVQTLLHEMIHAYLFVTDNNKDHDGHGPSFLFHMHRINKATGAKITVYHSFHQEVTHYRQHWWKCNGPCQHRPPYFGMVMRAMNRCPSARDPWWSEHQRTCGGVYVKIKEPEGYGKKVKKKSREKEGNSENKNIRVLLGGKKEPSKFIPAVSPTKAFIGRGITLGTSTSQPQGKEVDLKSKILLAAEKRRTENEAKQLVSLCGTKRKSDITTCQKTMNDYVIQSPIKKSRLNNGGSDCIIISDNSIGESSRTSTDETTSSAGAASNEETSSIIVIPDDDTTLSGDVSNDDVGVDPVTSKAPPDSWFQSDFKTCPVCGMGNIPAEVINIHVSLCLEAEEQFKFVDNIDDL